MQIVNLLKQEIGIEDLTNREYNLKSRNSLIELTANLELRYRIPLKNENHNNILAILILKLN